MAERNRQFLPWQSGFFVPVDEAFQEVLKHFADRQIAKQRLKKLELWAYKDGRWRVTDMDRYGLYIDLSQAPDGWHASIRMQSGRIGIEDFDSLTWAFLRKKLTSCANRPLKSGRCPNRLPKSGRCSARDGEQR